VTTSLLLSLSFNTRGQLLMAIAQTSENSFETYSNPTFGIRIQYPSDWGRLDLSFLENNSADIDFYPLDDISGAKAVKIQVDTLPLQNMTLDDYTDIQINSTEEQLLDSNTTVLANLSAHEIVFTNLGIKTMQVWTIKDDKVYTITYTAEEEDFQNDLQVAKMMIESFEITN
jgi:serine/threonine-protein kinase